ncbi:MAG: ion channel [Pseudomonadota bacterium]
MLLVSLALSAVMVALTVVIHFLGLIALSTLIFRRSQSVGPLQSVRAKAGATLAVVLGLFAVHTVQIWMYAVLYLMLGEFQTLEAALYFSTSTFTTVGFGDVYLDEPWRMLAAIESANGFLLIGWSTAFLISVTSTIHDIDRKITALRNTLEEKG